MANTHTLPGLALYQYRACPFCARTRQVQDKLGLNIEQRDVLVNPNHRKELIQQGGSPQVPCLRIEKDNGQVQWLYESGDIIKYFNALKQKQNAVSA